MWGHRWYTFLFLICFFLSECIYEYILCPFVAVCNEMWGISLFSKPVLQFAKSYVSRLMVSHDCTYPTHQRKWNVFFLCGLAWFERQILVYISIFVINIHWEFSFQFHDENIEKGQFISAVFFGELQFSHYGSWQMLFIESWACFLSRAASAFVGYWSSSRMYLWKANNTSIDQYWL